MGKGYASGNSQPHHGFFLPFLQVTHLGKSLPVQTVTTGEILVYKALFNKVLLLQLLIYINFYSFY